MTWLRTTSLWPAILSVPLCFSQPYAAPLEIDPIYPNENGPPPEGGMVDTADAKFYFLSDVEDSTLQPDEQPTDAVQAGTESLPLPRLVPWVRNVNDHDLTFIWQDQQIYRIAREHPLPYNAVESYPHSVCGYYLKSNSTILYTQQQRRVTTSAYQMRQDPQRPSCKTATEGTLWSALSALWSTIITSYRGEDDKIIDVKLNIKSEFDGDALVYQVHGDANSIGVGLSGLHAAFTEAPSARIIVDSIEGQLKDYGFELQVFTLRDHLRKAELTQLPPRLREEDFLVFSEGEVSEGDFEFRVPIGDFSTVAQSVESVAVFDTAGNLISVGPVALYVPQ